MDHPRELFWGGGGSGSAPPPPRLGPVDHGPFQRAVMGALPSACPLLTASLRTARHRPHPPPPKPGVWSLGTWGQGGKAVKGGNGESSTDDCLSGREMGGDWGGGGQGMRGNWREMGGSGREMGRNTDVSAPHCPCFPEAADLPPQSPFCRPQIPRPHRRKTADVSHSPKAEGHTAANTNTTRAQSPNQMGGGGIAQSPAPFVNTAHLKTGPLCLHHFTRRGGGEAGPAPSHLQRC